MKHESNHGKSKLAIKNNNLYGFRGKYGYYKYNSKKESIIAYKKYESRIIAKYKVSSRDQYLAILSRIYASDSKWLYRVKSHI